MKAILRFLSVSLLIFAVSADEKTVARWDFATGKTESSIGHFPLILRGNTKPGEKGLAIGYSPGSKPGGAVTRKIHPELSPPAFRLTVRFRGMPLRASGKSRSAIWLTAWKQYPL